MARTAVGWEETRGDPLMPEINVGDLLEVIDTVTVIDVRSPGEFEEWSIPSAINLPLEEIEGRVTEVPRGTIVLVCAAGRRASLATDILASHGLDSLVLSGGMGAWGRAYDEVARTFGAVTVVQIRRRGKGCLAYVVGGADTCIVIDPSLDIERPVAVAQSRGWAISYVVDTHLHADHLSGARLLAEATGATLLLNGADPFTYEGSPLLDGSELFFDPHASLKVSAVATPGHTRGSTTFALSDEVLFTGDTLFVDSVGRPDLAEHAREFAKDLFGSIHDQLLTRRDGTLVLPAHFGPGVEVRADRFVGATLGSLRASLPALSMSEASFIDWASSRTSQTPPNYQSIIEANISGAVINEADRALLEFGPNRCAVDPVI